MKMTQANLAPHKLFLFLIASLTVILAGCHRYQDGQLVGSWVVTTNRVTQTFTFAADHRFTCKVESSKNLAQFGDWARTNDQLTITIRSNSWTSDTRIYPHPNVIRKLTATTLVLENPDDNSQRAFTKK